jgi:hypothetical protein
MSEKITAKPDTSDSDSFMGGSWPLRSQNGSLARFGLCERRTDVKKNTTKKRSRMNWARIDALKEKAIDTC